MSIFAFLAFGFLLGLRHATDADHVVAITTVVSKQKYIKGSTIIGILWGIGHSITVTLVGVPIIFYSLKIPAKIGMALEFSVGVMLMALGIINLYGLRKQILKKFNNYIHKHKHFHDVSESHSHLHLHASLDKNDDQIHHLSFFQITRPVFIGLVHGLAGSSAIAILILSKINSTILAAFYLVIFHIGVIAGMIIITTLLGASINLTNQKLTFLHKYLVIGSGILSLVFGLSIIYKIGFVDRLFMLY